MKTTLLALTTFIGLGAFAQVKDVDGNEYKTVIIGEQEWMAENLNVSHFRNGDEIPEAKTDEEWKTAANQGKPAWCYLNNDAENGEKYGKLYNWYAVNDSRGLAPEGYKIPSEQNINDLEDYVWAGGDRNYCISLRAEKGWFVPSVELRNDSTATCKATNKSGFTALPSQYRNGGGNLEVYHFPEQTATFAMWTMTIIEDKWEDSEENTALSIQLNWDNNGWAMHKGFRFKGQGYSVRCIKD